MRSQVKEMENLFLSLKAIDKNINGIGLGNKTKNGITLNETAVIVYVKNKMPISSISPEKLISNEFIFNDKIYKSDVVQSSSFNAFIDLRFGSPCNGNDVNSLTAPASTSNIFLNRSRLNILSGGCNFAVWSPSNMPTFSTLGGIFKDKLDGTYVGLTNRHSIDKFIKVDLSYINIFTGAQELTGFTYFKVPFLNFYSIPNYSMEFFIENDPNYPDYRIKTNNFANKVQNYSIANSFCYQPSRYTDNSGVPDIDTLSGNNCFGYVKRATPVLAYDESKIIRFNYVDGAVIGIKDRVDSTSKNQIGFYYLHNNPSLIATDEEIDFIFQFKRPLFYSGSRSGPMGREAGATACTLRPTVNYRVVEIGSALFGINDVNRGENYTYLFSDCIEYESAEVRWTGAPPVNSENYCTEPGLPPPGWFPCDHREGLIPGDSPRIDLKPALLPGDSGSLVWGLLSAYPGNPGGWKIVGLNFATTHTDSIDATKSTGIFCRITNVMRDLNLEPWNGEPLSYAKNTMHEVVLDDIDFSKLNENLEDELVRYIEIDGEKYYYSGSRYTNKINDLKYKL